MPAQKTLKLSQATAKRQAKRSIVIKRKKSCALPHCINVTDKSPPEEILHASWKFLTCFQFLSLFTESLKLPHFSIDTLEQGILFPCPSKGLTRTMSSILADEFDMGCVVTTSRVSKKDNPKQLMEDVLFAVLTFGRKRYLAHCNSIHEAVYDFVKDNREIALPRDQFVFWHLDVVTRVNTLKELIDAIDRDKIEQWKVGMVPEEMRLEPIGYDSDGWTYWTFDNTRLYRELPMNLAQQKTALMLSKTDYTFELICQTADEWREYAANATASARGLTDKVLAAKVNEIATVVIGRLEAIEAGRVRKEARMKKAEMLETIPRKRSRRLEEKEDELNKQRKIEELEEQRRALEEFEREQEKKKLREKREKEEEMLRSTERELRDTVTQIIEDRLNKEIESETAAAAAAAATTTAAETSMDLDVAPGRRRGSPIIRDTPKIMFLKELRGILRKGASLEERVAKMQGWATLLQGDDAVKIVSGPSIDANLTLHEGLKVEAPGGSRQDLTSPLLKNILRVYLTSLPVVEADTGIDLQTIKKKMLLDQYKHDERNLGLENFIEDLDLAIPQHLRTEVTDANASAVPLRQYAAELLVRIFQNV